MLAAGVAHEINNPLSYVLYNLESLADDLPPLISALRQSTSAMAPTPFMLDDVVDRFKDALEGTRRIKDVARGLATFSRVDDNRREPVNLAQVIDVAINMVFNEIKYRARLVKDYGRISSVMASDAKLSQVFLNLLVNAAHAIDEGDIEDNEIRVRTWQEGEEVCAEVRDSGRGVAEEHLSHLFEPFFSTKDIGVSTGLGLSISKNIVEDYEGRIDVTSAVGEGTSFIVRLPIRAAHEPPQVMQQSKAESGAHTHGRVLVIDDEAGIRAAMLRMLDGHTVIEAKSGEEALKILEADQAFDVILCDVMMPGMSGTELHQWLAKTHPQLAGELVFITGGAFTPKAREYLAQVDNTCIEKPFDPKDFKRTVAALIRTSQEHVQ
ncbi:MAG: hybrid sensor histidine kinase/response regulator [Deltaproteobacteria bacterium]|nr:hybrid sensor histidine kinase/response regulator [Deltaproteobacteria bacterium]